MNRVFRPLNSSIGCKITMAVTGLFLVGFLVAHLAGNLLVFAGPEALNTYAKTLRDYLPLLWVARIGLILFAALHIVSGIKLTRLNQMAKPEKYKVPARVATTIPAKYMAQSGLVVLAFILYHLAHLTFRLTHAEFASLGQYDAYEMLILSFKSPFLSAAYTFCIVLLMMHLNHGVSSLFQTLGLSHPKYHSMIKSLGPAISLLLAGGFISIPLSVFFGLIK